MPDDQNPYQDEDEARGMRFSPGHDGTHPEGHGNEQEAPRMPRKAIPRKSTSMPIYGPEYGEESDGNDGSQSDSPPPVRPARKPTSPESRAKLRKAEAPSGGSADVGGIQEVLFQAASMFPGMRKRMQGGPSSKSSDFEAPRTLSNPGGARISAFGEKAGMGTTARPTEVGPGSDRGPTRPVARGPVAGLRQPEKPSAIGQFFERLQSMFSAGDVPVQKVEDTADKTRKIFIQLGIIVAVIVVYLLAYNVMPRKAQAEAFGSMPHDYHSAEKDRSFVISDPATCEVAIGPDTLKTQLRFFLNDWRDVIDVIIATPFQKQFWLFKTEGGVKDSTGSELYQARGPQAELCDRAVRISEAAQQYYAKNKAYPTTVEQLPADIKYDNPYTHKKDKVVLRQYTEGNKKSGEDMDRQRLKMYEELVFSKSSIETKAEPGSLVCWNVKLISAIQNINVFIIKPYGIDGNGIAGGHPGTRFMIALEDGKPKDLLSSKPLFDWVGKGGFRPVTVLLFSTGLNDNLAFLLRHSAKIIFTILAFGSLGFLFSGAKGLGRIFWITAVVVTGIPAILCFVP